MTPKRPVQAKPEVTAQLVVNPTNSVTKTVMLPLSSLVFDSEIMTRAEMNEGTVKTYASFMKENFDSKKPYAFPAIKVVKTKEGKLLVADGWHRSEGAKRAGLTEILCEVVDGNERDALLYGLGANSKHGLKRNPRDLFVCVGKLLADKEWAAKPNPWLAEKAGCSESYIRKIKKAMEKEGYIQPAIISYTDSKGIERLMLNKAVSNLNKQKAEQARLDSIIPNQKDFEDIILLATNSLQNCKPEEIKSIVTTLKLNCAIVLKGENPFPESVKEDQKSA